jgi:hypothetical protein
MRRGRAGARGRKWGSKRDGAASDMGQGRLYPFRELRQIAAAGLQGRGREIRDRAECRRRVQGAGDGGRLPVEGAQGPRIALS